MDGKYKILAVDDDPQALILIEAILKPRGYDLILLKDGKQTIQTIKREEPDIILLDIMMPVFDGYTILKEIRADETIKNIPVVMVTALEQVGNKVIASICGASAYITKPINREILLETIARLLPDSESR